MSKEMAENKVREMEIRASKILVQTKEDLAADEHMVVMVYSSEGYALASSCTDRPSRDASLIKMVMDLISGGQPEYAGDIQEDGSITRDDNL